MPTPAPEPGLVNLWCNKKYMTQFPLYVAAFILLIGVLIVVHEYGHFMVARLCGVKVLRFSVGFGPVIWSRRYGPDQTEYSLSLLPLGGYVRMLDEREAEVAPEELSRAFNRQSIGRRSAIVAAGPAANLLLAVLIYWSLFWLGSEDYLPVLGPPVAESPAAKAGITGGERVLSIDGTSVATWEDFLWLLLQKAAKKPTMNLELLNEQGQKISRELDVSMLAERGWEEEAIGDLGLRFYSPRFPAVVSKVTPNDPAALAGLRPGDKVVSVDSQPIETWTEMAKAIGTSKGQTLNLEIQRDQEILHIQVTPKELHVNGKSFRGIGVESETPKNFQLPELRGSVQYGFFDSGMRAFRETWNKSAFSLTMFGKILTGEAALSNLSGPVTIAEYAGKSAQRGAGDFLKFMALVSISLGILNLLPIPVLDGGHLMYHILELIKGGPLSERAMLLGQRFGMILLFTLITFALFNDLSRSLGRLFNG